MPNLPKKPITVGLPHRLTVADCAAVARQNLPVHFLAPARQAMEKSLKTLDEFTDGYVPIYGLTTQFGDQVHLLDKNLSKGDLAKYRREISERQYNLIRSHNIGMGEAAPAEISRAAMLLRAHCLAAGYSGIRPEVVQTLVGFLNKKIHPVIRRYGSIGASGDLIPLSAIASALIGDAVPVEYKKETLQAGRVLKAAGVSPLKLSGREGLALINGTSYLTAVAALAVHDLDRTFWQLLRVIGMSLEALMVIDSGYAPVVHAIKGHEGQMKVAEFLRQSWRGSKLIQNLHQLRTKAGNGGIKTRGLQDYYSLRSVAQGFGPFLESLKIGTAWIEQEANGVSDNPVVDAASQSVHHGANFMGYYVTSASDLLKTEIAQASSWVHAILANLLHARKSAGLPTNLTLKPEWFNGFRPAQILAAALAVQNRKLAQSQQAFMLPTEGDNQDVSSLAAHGAWDLREAVENLERLTAILLFASAQAIRLRGISKAGKEAQRICKALAKAAPPVVDDRDFAKRLQQVILFLRTNSL